jgi:hypothetical protein
MMNHRQHQHPRGVKAQLAPVHQHQQEPLTQQRSEQRYDAKVPHLAWIYLCDARSTLGEKQSRHDAQSGKRAIGWNEDRSDV